MLRLAIIVAAVATPAAAAEAKTMTFETITLKDDAVRMDPALKLLKPKGWTASGGPKWYFDFAHQVSFEIRLAEPGGPGQIEYFPQYWFTYSAGNPFPPAKMTAYMGQVWLEPHNAEKMLAEITIPAFRAKHKPKLVAREKLADLAKAFQREDGQEVQAARVRIEYMLDGIAVEEDFYIVLTYFRLKDPSGDIINWSPAIMPFALRAAKGKLEALSPMLLASAFSLDTTPEYYKRIRLAQAKYIGNLKRFGELERLDAQRIYETRTSINAIYRDMAKARDASNQRTYQTRNDLLGGVAPYASPDGRYLLPNSHKFQWAGSDGTVILTDDPNFDPSLGSRYTWSRLTEDKR